MGIIKTFCNSDKDKVIEFNKLVHGEAGIEQLVNNIMFKNPFNSLEDFVYIEENGEIASMVGLLKHKLFQVVGQVCIK